MTSNIRVGRGFQDNPKIGRYGVGQGMKVGRSKMAKKRGTSLMDVPLRVHNKGCLKVLGGSVMALFLRVILSNVMWWNGSNDLPFA